MRLKSSLPVLALACLSLACTSWERRHQLERVAKDWCLTIRASQVIPVYPLTEDLQPGDVFLVQTPVEEQVEVYEKRGFLPLEQMLVRLQPEEYRDFYLHSHGIGDKANTPHHWKFPAEAGKNADWPSAPWASFPTYGFSVSSGAGLKLAVALDGIPVAMSLLGASSAHGSMAIKDAHTYGVDGYSVEMQVRRWARTNRDYLWAFEPQEGSWCRPDRRFYLRVVTRVYLAQSVLATITADKTFGAGVLAGAAKPMDVPEAKPGKTIKNYNATLKALNKSLKSHPLAADMMPGGSIQIVAASGRTISLNEQFPRPLVIGYIGFDLPILGNGQLGPRIPTQALLSRSPVMQGTFAGGLTGEGKTEAWSVLSTIYSRLKDRAKTAPNSAPGRIVPRLDDLAAGIPDTLDFAKYKEEAGDHLHRAKPNAEVMKLDESGFDKVISYWTRLHESVTCLERFVSKGLPFHFNDKPADAAVLETLRQDLQAQQQKLDAFEQTYGTKPAVMEAVDYYCRLLKGEVEEPR